MKLLCLFLLLVAVQGSTILRAKRQTTFETKGDALGHGTVESEADTDTTSSVAGQAGEGEVESHGTGKGADASNSDAEGTVTEDTSKKSSAIGTIGAFGSDTFTKAKSYTLRVKNQYQLNKARASMLGSGVGAVESSVDGALTATDENESIDGIGQATGKGDITNSRTNGTVEIAGENKDQSGYIGSIGVGSGDGGKDSEGTATSLLTITKDGKVKLIGGQGTENSNTDSGTSFSMSSSEAGLTKDGATKAGAAFIGSANDTQSSNTEQAATAYATDSEFTGVVAAGGATNGIGGEGSTENTGGASGDAAGAVQTGNVADAENGNGIIYAYGNFSEAADSRGRAGYGEASSSGIGKKTNIEMNVGAGADKDNAQAGGSNMATVDHTDTQASLSQNTHGSTISGDPENPTTISFGDALNDGTAEGETSSIAGAQTVEADDNNIDKPDVTSTLEAAANSANGNGATAETSSDIAKYKQPVGANDKPWAEATATGTSDALGSKLSDALSSTFAHYQKLTGPIAQSSHRATAKGTGTSTAAVTSFSNTEESRKRRKRSTTVNSPKICFGNKCFLTTPGSNGNGEIRLASLQDLLNALRLRTVVLQDSSSPSSAKETQAPFSKTLVWTDPETNSYGTTTTKVEKSGDGVHSSVSLNHIQQGSH